MERNEGVKLCIGCIEWMECELMLRMERGSKSGRKRKGTRK